MFVIRPVKPSDLNALYHLALKAGHGLTTLPAERDRLREKIEHSTASFKKNIENPEDEYYFFVLEDTLNGNVVGTSALEAAVGTAQPFYTYKKGIVVHSCQDLDVHNSVEILLLGNDYTGCTELCTLFLDPDSRKSYNGRLLSKSRFLFVAQFPQRFATRIIAEMRGISDENGESPFWNAVGGHFFTLSFSEADRISGLGSNQFIAELMPKYPIYVSLLPDDARLVIGKVHPKTLPALRLLQSDGFHYRGYVDIFDAGPTVECETDKIDSVQNSRLHQIEVVSSKQLTEPQNLLIANCEREAFRACMADVVVKDGRARLTAATADKLDIVSGDCIRVVDYH